MIIRINNYPTGIRPIIPNHIEEFKPILYEFEKAKIHYYLGIVPGICTSEDWEFLNTLRYMIPACNGYDHLYPIYSAQLIESGDIYNKKGLTGDLNEFKDLNYKETFKRLSEGIDILRKNIIRSTYAFIPPFNKINEHVRPVLHRKHITLLLSDIPASENLLTVPTAPFSNTSRELLSTDLKSAYCITLHLTWEWDLIHEGDNHSIKEFVEELKNGL